MKWKKILSLLLVAIFVFGSLGLFTSPAIAQDEGKYIDSISIEVRTSQQTGLGDTATGDLDFFLQTVEGKNYEGISEDWKAKLGTWRSVGSYNNLYLNPVHDKTLGTPEIKQGGEWHFNPFAIQEVRYQVNWLINRQFIADDMYGGYASPMYTCIKQEDPGYETLVEPVIDDMGMTPTGDPETAIEAIKTAIGDTAGDLENGDLVAPEDSDSGFWEYNGEAVEITGIIRIEDARKQIGNYFADQLEKSGIKVDKKLWDRRKAIITAFYSDPADLQWHFYTGGWIASSANRYQEGSIAQMYAPWYTYMPGIGDPSMWNYEQDELDSLTKDLVNGQVADFEAYNESFEKGIRIGVEESVRVFVTATYDYYPYKKDVIVSAATDVVTGWSDVFSPRTMQTTDGKFDVAQYSSTGALYMDNWNRIDGNSDYYSLTQKRMVVDFAVVNDPAKGTPIGMRADYTLETDYEWSGETLDKNMDVPGTALWYDTADQEWKEVGSGVKSAVKVTYDFNLGTFHDGSEFTETDILAWYAFQKELANNNGRGKFHSTFSSVATSWFDNIKGIEWGEKDGTFTIYGDYTFPVESKIASYFSFTPYKPWQINEAIQHTIMQTSNIGDGASGPYSWSSGDAENWVHLLAPNQCADFKKALNNMKSEEWLPEYLKEENFPGGNSSVAITPTESGTTIDNIVAFYDEYEHLMIGQGPFMIAETTEFTMELTRWTEEDGYPFADDYWANKLEVIGIELGNLQSPNTIQAGNDLAVSLQAKIKEDYPNQVIRAVTSGDDVEVTFELVDPDTNDVVANGTATLGSNGVFSYTVPGSVTSGLSGSYRINLVAAFEGTQVGRQTASKSVIVLGETGGGAIPGEVTYSSLTVNPDEGKKKIEEATVTATVANGKQEEVTVQLKVDGTVVDSTTVPANTTQDVSFTHTFDEPGEYVVSIGDQSHTVTVEAEKEQPGFTFALLGFAVIAAVLIYRKKEY